MTWPEFESERLEAVLLRVELYESRFLSSEDYPKVVDHLLRSASAACLVDREPEAMRYVARAAARMVEWVEAARWGRQKVSTFADFAATRGWLAVALAALDEPHAGVRAATTFLRMTANEGQGSIQNARLAAALLSGDGASVASSAPLCERSDPGLGLPWKRFALALDVDDEETMARQVQIWLAEKMEATQTQEWGAYNEVPIEISGALALATLRGRALNVRSDRVLTRFRP